MRRMSFSSFEKLLQRMKYREEVKLAYDHSTNIHVRFIVKHRDTLRGAKC